MKKTILIFFTLFTCAFLSAQNSQSLESICASLAAKKNTTGDFTQTKTIKTNNRKLKSSGEYIICPQGILWKTSKPLPVSLILTEDTMIQIAPNGNKSVMSGKDNDVFSNISEVLSSVFSGNVDALKKNFNCKFQMTGSSEWTLELEPKDSTIASVMKTLLLSGIISDANGAEMKSLLMTEASENTITYEFTNQKYPKELSADEKQNFVFK